MENLSVALVDLLHLTAPAALIRGEEKPGSFVSELYAQVMARFYLLQCDISSSIPISISYDNISAADCSFLEAHPKGESMLAGLPAAAHFQVSKLFRITGFHVHSHEGHPWNELADSLCNYYKDNLSTVARVPCAPFSKASILNF